MLKSLRNRNGGRQPLDIAASSHDRLQTILSKQTDILAWRLLDIELQVLSSTTYQPVGEFSTISPSLLERGELYEELNYESFRFFNSDQSQSYLDLSAPLRVGNNPLRIAANPFQPVRVAGTG